MKILLVCTGNTCRSPMAEHLLRSLLVKADLKNITVISAGTRPSLTLTLPQEAKEALLAEGVSSPVHSPQGLSLELVQSADLILTMEDKHKKLVADQYPVVKEKVFGLNEYAGLKKENMDIADPFGGSLDEYRSSLADIKTALLKVIDKIKSE